MGKHTKGIANALAGLDAAMVRQRQLEEQAATLPDNDKRILHRLDAERRQEAIDAGR